ncbi:hypothetical protein [Thermoplasma acidophilum]|uniref:DNA-directed RNA polymerase subunit Rpo4 n=1 Tax=Thermoplasma acidophilum (strain ATCC 25905 / DSM 1728 / JCM 9062 / NBRC 15155 / AMRC-C165) TaxID=273075 RepID=Q9HIN7_THEAC|nr:hypothetical protein [Thermoplasma acidophilum]CAC12420.1 hypothetical protein [Thermoplasma acidophilum]
MTMEKKYISIPEVIDLLSNRENLTDLEKENLAYAEKFARIDPKAIKKVREDILSIVDMPEKALVKILDLKPETPGELTAILSTYGVMISDENLNALTDYLKKLRF